MALIVITSNHFIINKFVNGRVLTVKGDVIQNKGGEGVKSKRLNRVVNKCLFLTQSN